MMKPVMTEKDMTERGFVCKRVNRPTKDYRFVPGGRIIKNETIGHALKRSSQK